MPSENLYTALAALTQAVDTLESGLAKFETRAKAARKKAGNQMDLFGGGSPATSETSTPDTAEMVGRIDRVMTKIKTVLGNAA